MRPADQITGNSAHIALSCLWSQRGGKVRKKGLRGTAQGAAYGEIAVVWMTLGALPSC